MLAIAAIGNSPAIDDTAHLAAGISHWELGRYELFKVNPPLVRMLSALPAMAVVPETDWANYYAGIGSRPEFAVMDDFARVNGPRVIWLVAVARWGLLPLAFLGGCISYRWARSLYGGRAGLLGLVLWSFCPNLLAYAGVLTADAGAAALGVAASYLFWKWLRHPAWHRTIFAGLALGLAELTKTTWLVLFGLWPGLFVAWNWQGLVRATRGWLVAVRRRRSGTESVSYTPHPVPLTAGEEDRNGTEAVPYRLRNDTESARYKRHLVQMAVILGLGVFVINAGYDFEGSGTRLRAFAFLSRPLTGVKAETVQGWAPGNRFTKTWLGGLPIPLPRNYVEGIDWQWHDIELGKPSYLRGRWEERGWWYWYLYALAVKVPLGTWGLFLLAVSVRMAAWRRSPHPKGDPHPGPLPEGDGATRPHPGLLPGGERAAEGNRITWRDELVLLAPAAAVLVLVSSQTGFSRYLRYVLPAFPFVFIWISGVVATWAWPRSPHPQENPHPRPLPEREGGRNATEGVPYRGPEEVRNGTESVPYRFIAAFRAWCKRNWRGIVVCGLLAWSVGSSLWYAPHWMSYFNELAGGPVGGPKHLIDAQVDWGQDLLYLKKWYDTNPEARPLGLVYFGPIDPQLAGIEFELPPQAVNVSEDRAAVAEIPPELKPGWYAISVNFLYGYPHFSRDSKGNQIFLDRAYYSYFRRFEPVAMAGYSIYIYHLTADDLRTDRRPP